MVHLIVEEQESLRTIGESRNSEIMVVFVLILKGTIIRKYIN